MMKKYSACNVCKYCTHSCKVYGHGNPKAEIMIVGEGPGKMECETGIPFTGPAGKLMDEMLSAIGLKRDELYFTNIILCKTNEKNRSPSWDEIQNCAGRLDEEIEAVNPNVIIMAGSKSLQRFFGENTKLSDCRGHWFLDFKPPFARFFSIHHMNWALCSNTEEEMQAKKNEMWKDARILKRDLEVANFRIKETK